MDWDVLNFFASIWGRSPRLDDLVLVLSQNDLVKGGLTLGALWWFWAQPGPRSDDRRELVVVAIVAGTTAALASRLLGWLVPLRPRPISAGLGLAFPYQGPGWTGVSSFPSDHASLAGAIASAIFLISPPLGLLSFAVAVLLICLPRAYLGIHWATDLLAGLALGTAVTLLLSRPRVRRALAWPVLRASERWPGAFYTAAFLLTFGLMTRFESVRDLAAWVTRSVRR
jgi:undecaprenyl-diphosphatase